MVRSSTHHRSHHDLCACARSVCWRFKASEVTAMSVLLFAALLQCTLKPRSTSTSWPQLYCASSTGAPVCRFVRCHARLAIQSTAAAAAAATLVFRVIPRTAVQRQSSQSGRDKAPGHVRDERKLLQRTDRRWLVQYPHRRCSANTPLGGFRTRAHRDARVLQAP